MKAPTRRQGLMAGFLATFSLGFWVLSLVPTWWLQGLLGLAWLAGGVVVGWRLFPETMVGSPTVDAGVPVLAAVSESPEADHGSLAAEPLAEMAELEPEETPESVTLPLQAQPTPWREVLSAIEADWTRAETQEPAIREVMTNASAIRENVLRSFEIADNLAGSAHQAFTLSEKVQKGISVVTAALVESLKQAEILSHHSERITGILSLLSEVSDKIHVLSINASIVSARAGTAGRGFEVVAKEIRSLAKETEHSLGDIVEVIDLLRSSIARVIQVVRDADLETEQEKSSLIEVAGALQGVIMGVEIVKVVSGFAQDASERQEVLVKALVDAGCGPRPETRQKVADLKAYLEI